MPLQSEPFAAFAAALLQPDLRVPAGLSVPVMAGPNALERRFAVHRNTVTSGLVDVLAATFPAVLALVGKVFFRAAAAVFIRGAPPHSPVLIDYGGGFPAFLAGFPPAADLPYLHDVAALEWAWSRAYNAADEPSADVSVLGGVPAEQAAGLRVRMHPSVALLRSTHPVVSLWAESTGREPQTRLDLGKPENALILRPGRHVDVRRIPPASAAFLDTLDAGGTLAEAAAGAIAEEAFDPAREIAAMFAAGLVSAVSLDSTD